MSKVPSYHLQQNIELASSLIKALFSTIKKGELPAVKQEREKIGIKLSHLIDPNNGQNASFSVPLIKNESQSLKMLEWIISEGV
jgi:hypothetical protein